MSLYSDIQPPLVQLGRKLAVEKALPFVSDSPMTAGPDYSWASFRRPQLRACILPREEILWKEKIGMGLDGVIWRVEIRDKPYAIKVVSLRTCFAQKKSADLAIVLGRHSSPRLALLGRPERVPKCGSPPNDADLRRGLG